MSEKRFEVDIDHLLLVWDTEKNKRLEIEDIVDLLNKQHTIISQLKEENKQLKCINDQTDEEMTNMECLLLLIPFVILFVLLTGIIIAFLVQLGWVVI